MRHFPTTRLSASRGLEALPGLSGALCQQTSCTMLQRNAQLTGESERNPDILTSSLKTLLRLLLPPKVMQVFDVISKQPPCKIKAK